MDPPEPDLVNVADGASGTDAPVRNRGRGRSVAVVTVAGLALGGAATFYVVQKLSKDWSEASEALRSAELGWVALGVLCAVLAMTSIGWGWRHVMVLLGVEVPLGRTIAWYYVGELAKYLPGSVWPVLGRGELARRGGVPRSRAYASVAMSLALLYLSGMFVATAFLPFALSGGGFTPWMLFLLALPAGLVALHHGILTRLLGLIERLTRRNIDLEVPQWRDSLGLVLRYVPTWILVGTATWALARSITPAASYPKVVFSSVLSWIAGFLAIPVPSGAGVREAVLTASSGLDAGLAAATAIVARIVFILVDVVGAAICAPGVGRRRAKVAVRSRADGVTEVAAGRQ